MFHKIYDQFLVMVNLICKGQTCELCNPQLTFQQNNHITFCFDKLNMSNTKESKKKKLFYWFVKVIS